VKTKISQDYIKALKSITENLESSLSQDYQKISLNYSGNSTTISSLAATPNSLVNFQGVGLRKMGGWFKVQLPPVNGSNVKRMGDLLAWLDLEKVDKYSLAEKTIDTMQRLTSPIYTFSFLDLKNVSKHSSSNKRRLKPSSTKILSSNSLKSGFIYENELFSLNDSKEGIRLICSRPSPKPINLLKNYNKLLYILIPVLFLFFLWAKIFKINFSFSVKTQAALIFGFSAFIGVIAIIISISAYKYEKKDSITNKFKQEAIEILEKVDQQYSDSFDDLLLQYRHFKTELADPRKSPKDILSPLIKANQEEIIAYAVYVNQYGRILFHVPEKPSDQYSNIAKRYSNLVNHLAIQGLKTFNSSRSKIESETEPPSVQVFTATAVEGLLSGRSKFIETKLDNEETLAFMDFTIDENDFATGCLLIIHEPQKLERHYLNETGVNINNTKDYELIAFPKTSSNQKSYYPRFSYYYEEPLWKLNDMVNQTQLPSFKNGRINDKEVLVAAIPANKMKNYNLFLSMPIELMGDKTISLSNVLLIGSISSLLFIIVISVLLSLSINGPMNILRKNVSTIKNKENEIQQFINYSESSELESISTGITNLIIKTKEFYTKSNIVNELMPFTPYIDSSYETNIFNSSELNSNSLYYVSSLAEQDVISIFAIKNGNEKGLESSIPLAMAGTVLKILIEQTGQHSPSLLLSNLEEYFRVNHKISLNFDAIVIFLDRKTGILNYSGYGKFNLIKCNNSDSGSECEIIKLLEDGNSIREILETGDINLELTADSTIAISDRISDNQKENLKNSVKGTEANLSKEELLNIISQNIKTDKNEKSFLYIYRKNDNKNSLINKKLAETNPIALIRSQKNGSQPNV
ncbi:MAG: hypothetical protein IKP71_05375, partial [Candidatus Riflebacteria bacterium]|nr:hypothetical protein [Candidatus Riflebacteria bacterium]